MIILSQKQTGPPTCRSWTFANCPPQRSCRQIQIQIQTLTMLTISLPKASNHSPCSKYVYLKYIPTTLLQANNHWHYGLWKERCETCSCPYHCQGTSYIFYIFTPARKYKYYQSWQFLCQRASNHSPYSKDVQLKYIPTIPLQAKHYWHHGHWKKDVHVHIIVKELLTFSTYFLLPAHLVHLLPEVFLGKFTIFPLLRQQTSPAHYQYYCNSNNENTISVPFLF